jgi:hypothetical protein
MDGQEVVAQVQMEWMEFQVLQQNAQLQVQPI